jgi:hypothetical protein
MSRTFLLSLLVSLVLTQDSPQTESTVTIGLTNSSMIDEEKLEQEEEKFMEKTVTTKINPWLLE